MNSKENQKVLKAPIRVKRIKLDGDYKGFWFDVRLNPIMKRLDPLLNPGADESFDSLYSVYAAIVVDWNFTDEEGTALPCPKDKPEAFRECNSDQIKQVSVAFKEVISAVTGNAAGAGGVKK